MELSTLWPVLEDCLRFLLDLPSRKDLQLTESDISFKRRYQLRMLLAHSVCLLLMFDYVQGGLYEEYQEMTNHVYFNQDRRNLILPIDVEVERPSGCICRATATNNIVVCFGSYRCKSFPKITSNSKALRVRTTVIKEILVGDVNGYNNLNVLDIEANHQLTYIQPGVFRNLTRLEHLSISYNTQLQGLDKNLFQGLTGLRNLTLVNNGFSNILDLTPSFRPAMLPSLKSLDVSENPFEIIQENAFEPMEGTTLMILDIHLCRLEYVHPNAFLPLKKLQRLNVAENDLNVTTIANFLASIKNNSINLSRLDLRALGFRKTPPRLILDIIAETTVKWLLLADNQFEVITNDAFPPMPNIELIDLRRVYAIYIGEHTFDPSKFPNLKALLLGGNNLPGIHQTQLSNQLQVLDLSDNKGNPITPVYYEIVKDTFVESTELRILNLGFNRIKNIYDYTFRGLGKLKLLNLENGTIFHMGSGTFKPMKSLEVLNLANNPLTANENLTSNQFEGLNELRVLIFTGCGIRRFYDDDNVFEMMPNLTHLILKNNQLNSISTETLKPLKKLKVLDLSGNLFIAWWKPLFLNSGVRPHKLFLTNNKISYFSMGMIQDLNYLLESARNVSVEIDFMKNVFVCDCNSMYKTYLWLEVNGTRALKNYFGASEFECISPDLWEDRRVADYLSSVRMNQCIAYEKITNIMVLVWTAPSLVAIAMVLIVAITLYKFRIYIRYWLFLAKLALGRKFIRKSLQAQTATINYKYDAFVSYCFEDRDFVLEMISHLENNPPYFKLCISERDFEVGAFLSEAILSSINESRYVILIISNNFAKSQWCRWETQLAEYHRLFLEDGTTYDPLVLIRLCDVDNKLLTPTLRYLLKTKIYLSWDEENSENFWKKLKQVLTNKK